MIHHQRCYFLQQQRHHYYYYVDRRQWLRKESHFGVLSWPPSQPHHRLVHGQAPFAFSIPSARPYFVDPYRYQPSTFVRLVWQGIGTYHKQSLQRKFVRCCNRPDRYWIVST